MNAIVKIDDFRSLADELDLKEGRATIARLQRENRKLREKLASAELKAIDAVGERDAARMIAEGAMRQLAIASAPTHRPALQDVCMCVPGRADALVYRSMMVPADRFRR
jgi:hypothetical protein